MATFPKNHQFMGVLSGILGLLGLPLAGNADEDGIKYPSVDIAISSLRHAGASFHDLNENAIAAEMGEDADYEFWVLTLDGHPAHPAMLKYDIVLGTPEENFLRLSTRCYSAKPACKEFFDAYNKLSTSDEPANDND